MATTSVVPVEGPSSTENPNNSIPVPSQSSSSSSSSSSISATSRYTHLIVDTNAIITGTALYGLAENYWTVAEVLSEIRDEKARQTLAVLPYKLTTRSPDDESITAVRNFATKTGDIRALSKADILLLALTYQIEKEANGMAFIRSTPPNTTTTLGRPQNLFGTDPHIIQNNNHHNVSTSSSSSASTNVSTTNPSTELSEETIQKMENIKLEESSTNETPVSSESVSDEPEIYDDGEGIWIGPSGVTPEITTKEGQLAWKPHVPSTMPTNINNNSDDNDTMSTVDRTLVACMTTDFAMQNVLLQMGLLLTSHSGKIIDTVKQWVLKCDACFSIFPISATHNEHNLFCKQCGNATLARLGVTLGSDGTPRYHYKKNRVQNTRGTIYALPNPKGGREKGLGPAGQKGDLLLRPDQLLMGGWKEKVRQANSNSRETLMDSRTVDDILGNANNNRRSGLDGQWVGPSSIGSSNNSGNNAWIEVGWGKRNPNSNRTHHKNHKK